MEAQTTLKLLLRTMIKCALHGHCQEIGLYVLSRDEKDRCISSRAHLVMLVRTQTPAGSWTSPNLSASIGSSLTLCLVQLTFSSAYRRSSLRTQFDSALVLAMFPHQSLALCESDCHMDCAQALLQETA